MRLHGEGQSPAASRVRIFLAEKGISVPFEPEPPAADGDGSADVATIDRRPTLVLDDGTVIADPIAICRYFEGLRPEPPLFGRPGKEAALVEMWNRRIEHLLAAHDAGISERSRTDGAPMRECLEILDRDLKQHLFVVGDHYTIADITALILVDLIGPARLRELAGLRRWHAQVSTRSSVRG